MRFDTFTLDVRHALRSLAAAGNRAFALASVATLALAIAAVTAIVSIAYGMLFAPLPYADADRVVRLFERNPSRGLPEFSVSGPNLDSWRERAQSFSSLAAVTSESANVGLAGETERFEVVSVSPAFWPSIGLNAVAGRLFADDEAVFPGKPVAIVGERLANERFGGAARAVGQSILVNGAAREIVGVVPQDVGFATHLDLWVPLAMDPNVFTRGDRRVEVVGRLADGATLESARAELASVSAALAKEFPEENAGWEAAIEPVRDWIVGDDAKNRVLTLLAAVAVLMLVAASNVGSLQLARATRRAREIGVRQALGAGRSRLVAQLATENLVLVALASVIGIALAAFALSIATASLPAATPRLSHFVLNPFVAAGAIAVAALLTIAFGLLPTLVATRRVSLTNSLAQGGRTTADAQRVSLRQVLVVAQFTLSTVLLVGAVLLAQELLRMRDATLGFAADRLLVGRMMMPADTNEDYAAAMQRYDALLAKLGALPGVESVGIASEIPLGDFDTSFDVAAGPGKLTYVDEATSAAWRVVSSDYFATLGVPLMRGRTFAASDESGRSVILSAGLATKLFGEADAVGQTVKLGNGRNATVVGVAGDALQRGLDQAPTPTMYFPTTWILVPTMNVAIRAAGDPAALAPAVRAAAREVAPEFPLFDLGTMRSVVESSIAQPRLQTVVLVTFAGASLALAAIGIAGLLAFLVASRTPELALRLALGASARNVTGLVLGRGGALCAMGLAAGAIVSVALIGKFRSGVAESSLAQALLVAVAVLATVAFIACWLPARRVTRIDPSLALRGE